MMSRSCPDPSTLADLLWATLPAARQEILAEHLGGCAGCRARLDDLAVSAQSIVPGDECGITEVSRTTHGPPCDATEAVLHLIEPPESPDELGRLGPYRVLKVIGQGGMGIVLLAFDPALCRQVAVKLMRPTMAAHPSASERFLREARAAAAVHDDHVVTIHAVESDRGVPYLVMEYIAGRSLQDRLDAEGPLPMAEVADLGAQVADGLAATHALGLVHRDVKPANILIDGRTGRAKLTDFGLARAGDDCSLTLPGVVAGTPEYMAPEQACGQVVDHHADLYALGAVLFAAATGRPPHAASSARDLPDMLGDEARPPVRESAPDLPRALARLIEGLLQQEPARRPESAASVARALRSLAESSAPSRRRSTLGPAAAIAFACVVAAGAWQARGLVRSAPRKASPVTSVAVAPGSGGPFLLDGARRFQTLAAAIAAARSGATIEIGGDTPLLSEPIRLRAKALTLRAAPGCRPVLRFVPRHQSEPAPCLETDAALTLEGLEVHSTGQGSAVRGDDLGRYSAVSIRGGPFLATNCRFVAGPRGACLALRDGSGEVRACRFSAADGVALDWTPGPGHALDLRQDLLEARAAIVVDIDRLDTGRGMARLGLDRTTVRAHAAVQVCGAMGRGARGFADASRLDVRIESGGSVFDASHILTLVDSNSARRFRTLPPLESIARKIKARVAWLGHDDRYPAAPSWLSFACRGRKIAAFPDGPADRTAWERFWDKPAAGPTTPELTSHGSGRSPTLGVTSTLR